MYYLNNKVLSVVRLYVLGSCNLDNLTIITARFIMSNSLLMYLDVALFVFYGFTCIELHVCVFKVGNFT